MALFNLGSINLDLLYRVERLPAPGETLAARDHQRGLGGKGANMSVACARAGAQVHHIGRVGDEGTWAVARLESYGVGVEHVSRSAQATGHAVILLAANGENSIVIHPGANADQQSPLLLEALRCAVAGDTLLLQNETNLQPEAANAAQKRGMRVLYAAAPFCTAAVEAVRGMVDVLLLNEVEAAQLTHALGVGIGELGIEDVIVTRGAAGCEWYNASARRVFPAPSVDVADTTGAGDTFTGYLAAALDRGTSMPEAIEEATRAGALMVTRVGTADVIPSREELSRHRF